METEDSHVVLSNHDMNLKGTLDLPTEGLNLTVIMQEAVAGIPIEVGVTGTLDDPKTKLKVTKAVEEGLKQGAEQLLRGFLKGH